MTPAADREPTGTATYESFFGLREAPFSLAPDPRFLFASASHSAALGEVARALERREPLVVITGEIGTGKTLLCRTVLQRFVRKTFVSVVHDPLLERDEFLKQLLQDFGVISKDRTRLVPTSRHELVQALHDFLFSLVPLQAHAVVVIDEAQHLQPDVVEQIRLLSNVDDQRGTLLQIVLVGQTELETLLSRPDLRQMQQRISRRFRLEPLNRNEVSQYIEHRLAVVREGRPPAPEAPDVDSQMPGATELARALAEWSGPSDGVAFSPDAIDGILLRSRGLPRVINLLCDRALEEAYRSRVRLVDAAIVGSAATALGLADAAPPTVTTPPVAAPPAERVVADAPFWGAARTASAPPDAFVDEARRSLPAAFNAPPQAGVTPQLWKSLVFAAVLGAAVVGMWLAFRPSGVSSAQTAPFESAARAPGSRSEARPQATAPSAGAASTRPPAASASSGATPLAATPSGTTPPDASQSPAGATPPQGVRGTPSIAAATASAAEAAGAFDIVVASFRTEARAAAVAAGVSAVGLPARQRVSDGWQQVVCGPFASRAGAEAAQQQLQAAGFGGTQIVPVAR